MALELEPLHNNVIVRRLDPERVTASGIILPELTGAQKLNQGEVVAVGPGRTNEDGKLHPMHVDVGQRVIFGQYIGHEITVEGKKLLSMREEDIIAIVHSRD